MNYIFHIMIMICFYSILTISLDLVVGYGGIWFLGLPLCSGFGAYTAVITVMKLKLPVLIGLPIAAVIGCLVGGCFALIHNRIQGDFFLIISLGACEMASQAINEFSDITGGAIGIMNIPPIGIGNVLLIKSNILIVVFLLFLILIIVFQKYLLNGPFKLALIGSGVDQSLISSLGLHPKKYLRFAFLEAGLLAGIGGWLYAHYTSYLDPTNLSVSESIMIFCMVVIGGLKSFKGCIMGATVFYSVPLLLQQIGLSDTVAFKLRPIFFGFVLILYIYVRFKWTRDYKYKMYSK